MRTRRIRHQLRLSDEVWNSLKRVRLNLESHILVTEGVVAHVSPDDAIRLLLSEQQLFLGQLSPKDEKYLQHVMRLARRTPPPDNASSPTRETS